MMGYESSLSVKKKKGLRKRLAVTVMNGRGLKIDSREDINDTGEEKKTREIVDDQLNVEDQERSEMIKEL